MMMMPAMTGGEDNNWLVKGSFNRALLIYILKVDKCHKKIVANKVNL